MSSTRPPRAKRKLPGAWKRLSWKLKRASAWLDFISLPIVAGRLRGYRWTPAGRGKVLRFLLGTYEPEQTEVFATHLKEGDVLFDLGANNGYYTLLSAKLVGPRGRVLAFEPSPGNAHFLRKHVAINRLENVKCFEEAVGESEGVIRFSSCTQSGTGTGRVSDSGDIEVRMRCLDEIVEQEGVVPTHIKLDVEGSEMKVFAGAMRTLSRDRPVIFLSTHGTREQALDFFQRIGYVARVPSEIQGELVFYPSESAAILKQRPL